MMMTRVTAMTFIKSIDMRIINKMMTRAMPLERSRSYFDSEDNFYLRPGNAKSGLTLGMSP